MTFLKQYTQITKHLFTRKLFTRELLSQPCNFRSQILATAITIIHSGFRFQFSKAFISAAEVLGLQTLAKTSYFRIVTQKHNKHTVLFSTEKKKKEINPHM